jgi:hypothetical protein
LIGIVVGSVGALFSLSISSSSFAPFPSAAKSVIVLVKCTILPQIDKLSVNTRNMFFWGGGGWGSYFSLSSETECIESRGGRFFQDSMERIV